MSTEHKHTFKNLADKIFHKDHHHDEHHHEKDAHVKDAHVKDAHVDKNALGMNKETAILTKEKPVIMEKEVIVEKPVLVEKKVLVEEKIPVVQKVPVVSVAQTSAPIVHTKTYAPIVERHMNPTVVDQTVRKETVVEIQPVIHRMVEEPEIHVVEKHIYEKVPAMGPTTITKQAIVEETVKPRIIEEIQPVLHRDVPAPFIKHVEEHITEHEVRPTIHTREVLEEKKVYTPEEAVARGFVKPVVAPTAVAPIVHSHREAAVIDTHLNATIVEQTTRNEKVVEIQPIIHREIDAPEVHLIEKHMHESVPMTGPRTITKQAIVEEEIRPRIMEEIMPIIHREVPEMVVERVEEHITENVVAPTIQSREVVEEKRVGEAVALLPATALAPAPAPRVNTTVHEAAVTANVHKMLVEETARPEEVVEIQPIVHREVEAPEVHVIEQHVYESVPSVGPKKIVDAAIVEETVIPKVREEIKPVVHREVPVAVVEKVEEHVTEKVVAPTIETKEILVDGKVVLAPEVLKKATITKEETLLTATKPSNKKWESAK